MPCRSPGGGFPGPHPGGKLRGLAGRGVSRPTPGGGVCIQACTEADPPPVDGYCHGQYASYWNAFLFEGTFQRLFCYCPQTKFAKVMFLQVSVCPQGEACVAHGGGHVWQRGMHGRGACMAGVCAWQGGMHGRGVHGRGGMCGRGACMAGGHAWLGCVHGRGACMAGVYMAGGHAWLGCVHGRGACMAGVYMAGGMCGWGVCMAGGGHASQGGVCGWGACMAEGLAFMAGGHAWQGGMHGGGGACVPQQILRDTVNERAVRILLECILIDLLLYISKTEQD